MPKILIISSEIHKQLASEQLDFCLTIVKNAGYDYQVELLQAGAYEIPFVIYTYPLNKPFHGYIALGLILKTNSDHYDNIMSHIRHCFTQFALNDIIVGNGIISGSSIEELSGKVHSSNPCLSAYQSAFNAVDCLIKLKNKVVY